MFGTLVLGNRVYVLELQRLLKLILFSALLIFKTTLQHYVPPPSACLLSMFCNHTWVPECGQESVQKNMRMFLDLCDMYEYNCEQTKDYNKVDLKECPQDSTTMSTTDTTSTTTTESTDTTVSIDTTASATITVEITKPSSESTAKPEHVTTISTETTTFSRTIASISTESTTKSCSCSCMKATEVTSTTEPPTTYSRSFITTTSTETTTLSTEPMNKDFDAQTTIVDYEETEAETYATIVEDIETKTAKTEASTPPSASLVTCSSYPEHCDVPSTWETTAKGERRDFFQILRERFGDRVRVLRATTHWPRRVLVNNQQSAFLNGRHRDSQMK